MEELKILATQKCINNGKKIASNNRNLGWLILI